MNTDTHSDSGDAIAGDEFGVGNFDGNVAGNNFDKYASSNPIEQRMMRGFFDALDECLDRALDGATPRTVVEVGAGEGRITDRLMQRFPDATVVGLDLPDARLAQDWQRLDAPMLFGDATRLPFADGAIDLIVALEVLEHVPTPWRARDEIARVCQRAVLSVPREPIWRVGNMARGRYLSALGNTPGHINHWSARGFTGFVAASFDVVKVTHPIPWTMLAARPVR